MAKLRKEFHCMFFYVCAWYVLWTAGYLLAADECERTKQSIGNEIFGDIFQVSSRSLSVPGPYDKHKCQRELPVVFFQTKKHEILRGNGSTIYYHNVEVCCQGYARSRYDWRYCVPDCSSVSPNNCLNGFCHEPNRCVCYDDFVRNEYGECTYTCPIGCQHGHCHLDGTCVCDPGYVLDPHTQQFCRPECGERVCGTHQECVAPDRCGCKEGYRLTVNLGCQPICTPDCGHGKCVGPDRCECFAGFTKRLQRNVCEDECNMKCENGFCESRYVCQCREGYVYDANTTSCLPHCGDACNNGVCVAPGICRCFEGYELQSGHCNPICTGGCGLFGHCIEPQLCGCGNSESPHHCGNGNCLANGICECARGRTHFVDACIDGRQLETIVTTYLQKVYYDQQLRREFNTLIGRFFSYF